MANRLGKIIHWSGFLLSALTFLYLPSFGVIEIGIGLLPLLIAYGINDYLSSKSLSGDYWGTLIIFIVTLPGTLHIQNKE